MATKIQDLTRKVKDRDIINKKLSKENRALAQQLEKQAAHAQKDFDENLSLKQQVEAQAAEIEEIKKKLKLKTEECERLKHKLDKNSRNSSKPPSTDGYKKTIISGREKSERTAGGQKGHKGSNLVYDTPTEIIKRKPQAQCQCGGTVDCEYKGKHKQEIDIEIRKVVREERVYEGACVCCGKKHEGTFSTNTQAHIAYGKELKSLIAILSSEAFVPHGKIKETLKQITGSEINISEGTIVNIVKQVGEELTEIVEGYKTILPEAPSLYVDETSLKMNKDTYWAHTVTSNDTVVIEGYERRNFEAIEAMAILPGYTGVLMSDHYKMYNKLTEAIPARCNAHILRELRGLYELHKRDEIEEIITFFKEMNKWVKGKRYNNTIITDDEITTIFTNYHALLKRWQTKHAVDFNKSNHKRNQNNYYNDERLLIERLQTYDEAHLRFITHPAAKFDNNMAERSLRMIKTKMKVSGCFRSAEMMALFLKTRSFIQTQKLRNENYYHSIQKIFVPLIVPA